MKLAESINVAMTPLHPLGMTPSAVALSPDQTRLLVACSDANVVAVADISDARSRVLGSVPTRWHPTAPRRPADGRLRASTARGLQNHQNRAMLAPHEA